MQVRSSVYKIAIYIYMLLGDVPLLSLSLCTIVAACRSRMATFQIISWPIPSSHDVHARNDANVLHIASALFQRFLNAHWLDLTLALPICRTGVHSRYDTI
jgi:hypothetical protein